MIKEIILKFPKELRKKNLFILTFFLFSVLFLQSQTVLKKDETNSLNFKKFYTHKNNDTIFPSLKQIEMLEQIVPHKPYLPTPSIEDRKYWNTIATTASGKQYLEVAISNLNKAPEVPISDEIYRRANKEGNRRIYKPRYYRTMERLENFILAECIEDEGRFLSQIELYINAIIKMKSWLHPNHDDSENSVLEGKRISIDLGARKFGTDLALAHVLLGDKLSKSLQKNITKNVQSRIIDSYLQSCKISDRNNKWIKSSSNWNSVCSSGTLFSIIAISNNRQERIAAIGSALNSMEYYLNGFGDDGYCSEGVGYWAYGFGHYLYLAYMLKEYTNGKINLFDAGNPEKLKNIASYPERYEIQKGKTAPFADGVSNIAHSNGFPSILSAHYLEARKPLMHKMHLGADIKSRNIKSSAIFSDEAAYQLIAWQLADVFKIDSTTISIKSDLPSYTYFDDVGMVISRGKQEKPFSIAIKAGHNNENHNHMDVGSYSIVLDTEYMTGDIGAPSYIAGAFSDKNPARSSWGHPVPKINDSLQSKGAEFAGKLNQTKFMDSYDEVEIDMLHAYEIPTLKKLVRTMKNDKLKYGEITITDDFVASEPVFFGTAVMVLADYKVLDNETIVILSETQKIEVKISSKDGALKITDELVPVKSLREGGPAYRIGVDFVKPLKKGKVTLKFTPVL